MGDFWNGPLGCLGDACLHGLRSLTGWGLRWQKFRCLAITHFSSFSLAKLGLLPGVSLSTVSQKFAFDPRQDVSVDPSRSCFTKDPRVRRVKLRRRRFFDCQELEEVMQLDPVQQ